MSIDLLERRAQRHSLPAPPGSFSERAMAARKCEQGEGLIIEVEARIGDFAVELDDGYDRCVGGDEVLAEIIERMALRLTPGAMPAEPAGFAIGERLPGNDPCPVRPLQRLAVQGDCLVKTAANAIRTEFPPQRERRVEQPALERSRLGRDVAHASGLDRYRPNIMPVGCTMIMTRTKHLGIFRFILHEAASAERKRRDGE